MIDRIKIFSIATNGYHEFEEDFYKSFNELFLPQYKKEFVIFTDTPELDFYKKNNIKSIFLKHEPWPYITLSRYKSIANQFDFIESNDLCLFADIDLEVVNKVDSIDCEKYFGVDHPGNMFVDNRISLENNILSQAYVDLNFLPSQYKYIQGCLWGGLGSYFKYMVNTMRVDVELDLSKNIVAKWHDESHLNRFCINNFEDFMTLSSSYAYPENWKIPIEKIIIHKYKNPEQFPRFEGI